MNKRNWKYKKIGEVCNIYQPKTISSNMLEIDGKYPVYGANGIIGKYNRYNHEFSEILLTCRGATCGTINISEPFAWINGNAMVIHPNSEDVMQMFLAYLLKGIDMSDVITGAAQPQITRQSLFPKIIPIPPLEQQKIIILELGSINEAISMLQQQLKDLDALAQSIFYDMFGDPVANPRAWPTETMGKVAPCVAYKGIVTPKDGKFWLLNLDMVESQTGKIIDKYFCDFSEIGNSTNSFSEKNVLYSKLRPYLNKVVLPDEEGYCTSELLPLLPLKDSLDRVFLAHLLRSNSFVEFIKNRVAGAKMPRVSMNDFRSFNVILPPISLQKSFASQIEIIEKSKKEINIQVSEMQILLSSRMQYWFD